MNSNKAKFNSITKQSLASSWLSCQGNIKQFLQHTAFFFFFFFLDMSTQGKRENDSN
jgi:hypothetical protein